MRPGHTRTNTEVEQYEAFLDAVERDPDSVSGAGRSKERRRVIADKVFDDALDCSDPMLAVGFALRAVRLDPACLDARVMLALAADGPADELIEELEAIVAAGEADLGPEFFRENRGRFWGVIETRPYMRARTKLAAELYLAGRIADATRHYEELLQLNPNDNQGLRYSLLGHYLEMHDLTGAGRMFDTYNDEWSAMFTWARVLERYLSVDLAGAVEALQKARDCNPHVEAFLTGRKTLPRQREDFYSPGKISEAAVCMDLIAPAWKKYGEAVNWLKKERGSGHLFANDGGNRKS